MFLFTNKPGDVYYCLPTWKLHLHSSSYHMSLLLLPKNSASQKIIHPTTNQMVNTPALPLQKSVADNAAKNPSGSSSLMIEKSYNLSVVLPSKHNWHTTQGYLSKPQDNSANPANRLLRAVSNAGYWQDSDHYRPTKQSARKCSEAFINTSYCPSQVIASAQQIRTAMQSTENLWLPSSRNKSAKVTTAAQYISQHC